MLEKRWRRSGGSPGDGRGHYQALTAVRYLNHLHFSSLVTSYTLSGAAWVCARARVCVADPSSYLSDYLRPAHCLIFQLRHPHFTPHNPLLTLPIRKKKVPEEIERGINLCLNQVQEKVLRIPERFHFISHFSQISNFFFKKKKKN